MRSGRNEWLHTIAAATVAAGLCGGLAYAATTQPVSQQERSFHPGRPEVHVGDTVRILNDDGELIHHAYVATDAFGFDSGEQDPGSLTDIRFTREGTFSVRCRIHPKMLLTVVVTK